MTETPIQPAALCIMSNQEKDQASIAAQSCGTWFAWDKLRNLRFMLHSQKGTSDASAQTAHRKKKQSPSSQLA